MMEGLVTQALYHIGELSVYKACTIFGACILIASIVRIHRLRASATDWNFHKINAALLLANEIAYTSASPVRGGGDAQRA